MEVSTEELVPSSRHANDVIGAYVTAGTRIHLYLDRLQKMQFNVTRILL